MLRPPAPNVPTIALPGATNIPYNGGAYPPSTSPAVLSSLWRAPDGRVGYLFTNIAPERVTFDIRIDAASTLLPPTGNYQINLVRNGTYSLLQPSIALPVTINLALEPLDVVMVGVGPTPIPRIWLPLILRD